jgi:hypothetical protein
MEGGAMKLSKIDPPKKAPETFEELCRLFLPCPIHDEAENDEALNRSLWITPSALLDISECVQKRSWIFASLKFVLRIQLTRCVYRVLDPARRACGHGTWQLVANAALCCETV